MKESIGSGTGASATGSSASASAAFASYTTPPYEKSLRAISSKSPACALSNTRRSHVREAPASGRMRSSTAGVRSSSGLSVRADPLPRPTGASIASKQTSRARVMATYRRRARSSSARRSSSSRMDNHASAADPVAHTSSTRLASSQGPVAPEPLRYFLNCFSTSAPSISDPSESRQSGKRPGSATRSSVPSSRRTDCMRAELERMPKHSDTATTGNSRPLDACTVMMRTALPPSSLRAPGACLPVRKRS
ncbi:Uncharacterised protein [Collinsella intestinalis]|nr:Uncharacterised protein [Collinsella intestinalis]